MKNIQATGNLCGEHITIKQVSKIAASKEFEKGNTVYLQSSNMHPFGMWQSVCPITLDTDKLTSEIEHYNWCKNNGYELTVHGLTAKGQFNDIIGDYIYYNCDSERGKYVHFYVKVS